MKVTFISYDKTGNVLYSKEEDVSGFKQAREKASMIIKLSKDVDSVGIYHDQKKVITIYED